MCLYFLLCICPVTLLVNLNDIDFYYEGDEDNGNNDYDFYYEGDEDDGNFILLLFVFWCGPLIGNPPALVNMTYPFVDQFMDMKRGMFYLVKC